jgi:hypothetical protein
MSGKTLHEIEASIAQLDVRDQVRLLQYLAPRIANAVLDPAPAAASSSSAAPDSTEDAIRRLRAAGERLAATSVPGAPSIIEALTSSRR